MTSMFSTSLPIFEIDSWSDLQKDNLEDFYEKLKKKDAYNWGLIDLDSWKEKVKNEL